MSVQPIATPPAATATGHGGRQAPLENVPQSAALPTRPKLRRRPLLIAAALVLVTVGALTAAWLTTVVGHTVPVVAVRDTVHRGEQISRANLMTVNLTLDPALKTVPASSLDSIVGQYATTDLPAGGILPADAYSPTNALPAGHALVGVSLTPAQAPSQQLAAGDHIKIVVTPRAQDDPPTTSPATIGAVVVAARSVGDQGQVILDVSVPKTQAALLAATAATGRVAVIVDGTGN